MAGGAADRYDRIVFDIKGQIPGYDVRYVDKVIKDPSGEPATLPGRRFIVIRLEPMNAHTDAGEPTVSRAVRRLRARPYLTMAGSEPGGPGCIDPLVGPKALFGEGIPHRRPIRPVVVAGPMVVISGPGEGG